jgi:hypothetical protein
VEPFLDGLTCGHHRLNKLLFDAQRDELLEELRPAGGHQVDDRQPQSIVHYEPVDPTHRGLELRILPQLVVLIDAAPATIRDVPDPVHGVVGFVGHRHPSSLKLDKRDGRPVARQTGVPLDLSEEDPICRSSSKPTSPFNVQPAPPWSRRRSTCPSRTGAPPRVRQT